jgi:hypothetical protein
LETKEKLLTLYQDKEKYFDNKHLINSNRTRKEELQGITGSGQPLFGTFYDRLRELKEYHRKFPNLEMADPEQNASIDESKGKKWILKINQFSDASIFWGRAMGSTFRSSRFFRTMEQYLF